MTIEDVKVNLSDTRAKFAAKFIANVNLRHVKLSGEPAKCRYEHRRIINSS